MIVILGAGGHAKVCADVLRLQLYPVEIKHSEFDLSAGAAAIPAADKYVIGVGDLNLRRALYDLLGDQVIGIMHPTACLARRSLVKRTAQVMAGAIIQPGCKIGNNVLINTRASVDHDCIIGDHVHIAPGAILCGGVTVGDGAFIGAGAVMPEGRSVPAGAFVKAGSVFNG